jgi:hypothetical protein
MKITTQTVDDVRAVDVAGNGDYTSEVGNSRFLFDAGVGGDIVFVCPRTSLEVTVTVPDGFIGTYWTTEIKQAGTTASNILAIYTYS